MILSVSRGYMKVNLDNRIVTIPGEMFFPVGDKMGFVVFRDEIKAWDSPNEMEALSEKDVENILNVIHEEFLKGGHLLEVE